MEQSAPFVKVMQGDAISKLKELPDQSVHCVVTSPPYWGLRDYKVEGQIGLEDTPEDYTAKLVEIFREVRRVLRDDGTVWLNLGDSYAGSGTERVQQECWGRAPDRSSFENYPDKIGPGLKPKDLVGIPWRVAFALQADGWYLRSDIIWNKPNPMPESVRDRPTKSHEYIFLLSKSYKYYFDQDAVRQSFNYPDRTYNPNTANHKTAKLAEQGNRSTAGLHDGRTKYGDPRKGRNIRSVWTITTKPYSEAHFATFPPELPERCIKAGCPIGGIVLDPFAGSGTTGMVARGLGRSSIMIELNPEYIKLINERVQANLRSLDEFDEGQVATNSRNISIIALSQKGD